MLSAETPMPLGSAQDPLQDRLVGVLSSLTNGLGHFSFRNTFTHDTLQAAGKYEIPIM